MIKDTLIDNLYKRIKLNRNIREWKKRKGKDSFPVNIFNPKMVTIGKNSYGELNVVSFNNKSHLYIGNYVSIAQKVTFLLDVEHNTNTISTYPFNTKVLGLGDEAKSKGDIRIEDDVWIGYGATILSGVHIGQGAVIAAGAIVSKNVPPYAVVGGIPAKIIKYRFNKEIIEFMETLDFSRLTRRMIKQHDSNLYIKLDNLELCDIIKFFEWFPKK